MPDTPPVDRRARSARGCPGRRAATSAGCRRCAAGCRAATRRPFGTSSSVPWLNVATRSTIRWTLPTGVEELDPALRRHAEHHEVRAGLPSDEVQARRVRLRRVRRVGGDERRRRRAGAGQVDDDAGDALVGRHDLHVDRLARARPSRSPGRGSGTRVSSLRTGACVARRLPGCRVAVDPNQPTTSNSRSGVPALSVTSTWPPLPRRADHEVRHGLAGGEVQVRGVRQRGARRVHREEAGRRRARRR